MYRAVYALSSADNDPESEVETDENTVECSDGNRACDEPCDGAVFYQHLHRAAGKRPQMPGDFAAVRRKIRLAATAPCDADIVAMLASEHSRKSGVGAQMVGFGRSRF